MKKISLRKCLVKKIMLPKEDLLRIVKNKDGEIKVDPSFVLPGRGAYLSKDKQIIEIARKRKALDRAFSTQVDESIYDELIKLVERR